MKWSGVERSTGHYRNEDKRPTDSLYAPCINNVCCPPSVHLIEIDDIMIHAAFLSSVVVVVVVAAADVIRRWLAVAILFFVAASGTVVCSK